MEHRTDAVENRKQHAFGSRTTVQFTLRSAFIALTLCAVEAALVSPITTGSDWALVTAIPAIFLGLIIAVAPIVGATILWRETRIAGLHELLAWSVGIVVFSLSIFVIVFLTIGPYTFIYGP